VAKTTPQNNPADPNDGDFLSLVEKKVALDLDDAPFLYEEEQKSNSKPEPEPAPKIEEVKPKAGKKKLIVIIAVAAVLLLVIGAVVYFLFLRSSDPKPEPEPMPERPIIVIYSTETNPPEPEIFLIKLVPFVIPLQDINGRKYFLDVSLVISTTSGILYAEILDKTMSIRDSVFYYLNNQTYEFMRNTANTQEIKNRLASAVNDYLITADIDDIYIDEFLIR